MKNSQMKTMSKRLVALVLCILMILNNGFATVAEEMLTCSDCNANPCVCDSGAPEVCETCNTDPCVCGQPEVVDESVVCTVCNTDPCTCEDEPVICETCNTDPCTCEDEPVICET